MEILYLLIPLSIILVLLIAWVLIWSIQSGQYDDLEGPGYRILMDDDKPQRSQDEASENVDPQRDNASPADAEASSAKPEWQHRQQ